MPCVSAPIVRPELPEPWSTIPNPKKISRERTDRCYRRAIKANDIGLIVPNLCCGPWCDTVSGFQSAELIEAISCKSASTSLSASSCNSVSMSKPKRWITMSPGSPTSPRFGFVPQNHDLSSFISSLRVLRLQMACGSVSSRKDKASVLITFMIGRAVELRIGMGSMTGMSEKESCRAPTRVTRALPDHAGTIPSTRLK